MAFLSFFFFFFFFFLSDWIGLDWPVGGERRWQWQWLASHYSYM